MNEDCLENERIWNPPCSHFIFLLPIIYVVTYANVVNQKQQDAQSFLESQKQRLGRLEQQLFHATEHILPSDPQSMSVTELAELCLWVQESNRRQLLQLKHLLEASGCDAIPWEWEEEAGEEPLTSPHPSLPYTLLGRPLERVLEGDVETDGGTTVTPGSMGYQSPLFASTKKKRFSTTPTTPTMDSFSFRYVFFIAV
jgi:hypothetical protein